jgi:hypothetical protein
MAAYALDATVPERRADPAPAGGVPDPAVIPPEDTNL